jgi:hypothetical protein
LIGPRIVRAGSALQDGKSNIPDRGQEGIDGIRALFAEYPAALEKVYTEPKVPDPK